MTSKTFTNITFFLLLLYYVFSVIYPRDRYAEVQVAGRIYPQVTMTLTCLMGTWYAFSKYRSSRQFLPFFLFAALFWIYSMYTCTTAIETFSYILKSTSGYIFAIVFYHFLKQNEKQTIRGFTFIFFVIIIYGIISHFTKIEENRFGETESTAGFIFSQLLSFPLLFSNKKWSPYVFVLCSVMCLLSGQRTAALIAVIYCICAFYVYGKSLKISRIVIVSVLVVIFLWPYIIEGYENLLHRHERDLTASSYGSGRTLFYSLAFDSYMNSSVIQLIFGKGLYSTPVYFSQTIGQAIFAHNGWIDTVFQFGFIGLSLFASCIFSLFSNALKFRHSHSRYSWILFFMAISWVLKSSVSHGYLDLNAIPFSMSLAYIYYIFFKQKSQFLLRQEYIKKGR